MGSKKKSFPCKSGAHGASASHSQPPTTDEVPEELLTQRPTRSNRGRDGAGSFAVNTRRGSWSLPEDLCFLALLREMMIAGNHDLDSITRDQWEILLGLYNERTPGDKVDKHQLQCRLKTLKQSYSLNRALRSKRGWTWDDDRQMAIAPDDKKWEDLIEHNKQYRKVRRKPFPQYDTMDQMFGKSIAHDLKEECASSASSKEEMGRVEKDNGVKYVPPLAQMPPNTVYTREQSPGGGDAACSDPAPGSSSSRKRLREKSGSVKRRQSGHLFAEIGCEMIGLLEGEHERIQCINRYLRHCEGWKDDMQEVHKKIRSVSGITIAQRVAGMEACTNRITREMVKIFDPDELRYWLEKLGTEPMGPQWYPESVEVRERVVVSPGRPVPNPASCADDLVKTCVFTEIIGD